ncbi:Superoxide dismutase [Penicillium oxalicum]|uniref:Superoxide dismutase n=1 Tax=Penicillium oxalicum TaxID=69781 RepID=UPI0020B78065|nr:Superoxide dismutase [Penicillium oxalicum]KAI2790935.1 Superoxide dismutase [Penicillium oxalicum]
MATLTHSLPPLPYAYDALEPIISKQIMQLHHQKHHQTYINNLNAALSAQITATQSNDVATLISLQQKIKFNGGGHINHSLFWKNLTPPGSAENDLVKAAPSLRDAIATRWGSYDEFVKAFSAELLGLQGSGWGWLVSKGGARGRLEIVATKDQDPVAATDVPVFGVDMWEHAYYLQYLNNKVGYVEGIWKIINWTEAEKRYTAGVENWLKL